MMNRLYLKRTVIFIILALWCIYYFSFYAKLNKSDEISSIRNKLEAKSKSEIDLLKNEFNAKITATAQEVQQCNENISNLQEIQAKMIRTFEERLLNHEYPKIFK